MKLRQTAWTLFGSVLVFAACSSHRASSEEPTSPAAPGALEDAIAAGSDAILDAIQEVRDSFVDATGLEVGVVQDAHAEPVRDAEATSDTSNALPPTSPPAFAAGSRLKPKVRTFADGARWTNGWIDTARGEECEVGIASDGKERCLPTSRATSVTVPNTFSDASCTREAHVQSLPAGCTSASAPLPKYVVEAVEGCVSTRRYVAVRGAAPATDLYMRTSGLCLKIGDTSSGYRALLLGEEVPPTAFVEVSSVN
jgi:hypothetical protein